MNKFKKILIGSAAGALLFGSVAAIAFAAVSNGGFETGSFTANPFDTLLAGSSDIDNWSIGSGSIDWIGNYWQSSPAGGRSIDLNGLTAGSVSQTVPTVVGGVYKVTFDLSGNPDGLPADNILWSPSNKILNVSATGASSQNYSYDTSANQNTRTDMMWESHSYNFLATGTSTVLTFASTIPGAFGPALDKVSIEQLPLTNKDQCKKDGWKTFGVFKNQGDCVSFVATGGKNPPANQ